MMVILFCKYKLRKVDMCQNYTEIRKLRPWILSMVYLDLRTKIYSILPDQKLNKNQLRIMYLLFCGLYFNYKNRVCSSNYKLWAKNQNQEYFANCNWSHLYCCRESCSYKIVIWYLKAFLWHYLYSQLIWGCSDPSGTELNIVRTEPP